MVKTKTKYLCQQCGYESQGYLGRCPGCGAWNSLVETLVASGAGTSESEGRQVKIVSLSEIKPLSLFRIKTKIFEFNRVLGGGIVAGSVVLLAGDPGIGKSTLLLQVATQVAEEKRKVLYVSGEESPQQIKIRAERLGIKNQNLFFLNETNVDFILEAIGQGEDFNLVIIDSIQTLYTRDLTGTAGSVGQVRESTSRLLNFAKRKNLPMFLIGHVTKEGSIAGPMVLSHLVDTVLFLEGERFQALRLLRSFKNRFGPTDEVGVFEMASEGLKEVDNPSRLFLEERRGGVPGSVITCLLEGSRPLLIEVQALVVSTQLPVPRRVSQGIDFSRLQMLVAILSRRVGLPLGNFDIFVNLVGGIKVSEPSVDLAVSLAIASSFADKPLEPKTCALGEVGLLGEIREVGGIENRAKEARRLGFTKIISPKEVKTVSQAIKMAIGK